MKHTETHYTEIFLSPISTKHLNSSTAVFSPTRNLYPVPTGESLAPTLVTTSTPTSSPPIAESLFENSPVAFLVDEDIETVLLVDLETGFMRRLQFGDAVPISVDWSPEGCNLYVSLIGPDGVYILITDLKGNMIDKISAGFLRGHLNIPAW